MSTTLAVLLAFPLGFSLGYFAGSIHDAIKWARPLPDRIEPTDVAAVHDVTCPYCTRPAGYPCSSWDAARRGLWSAIRTHPSRIKAARALASREGE